jgi:hypothetical protein
MNADIIAGYGILGMAITGVVQALKYSFPGKVQGIVTIVCAVLIGLLAGYSNMDGLTPLAANLNPISGVLIALATVGVMTLAGEVKTSNR